MARNVVFGMIFVSLAVTFFGCATVIPATFKMVEASPSVSYEDAWLAVVDAIGERLEIEMVDKDSGYLRTGWKTHSGFFSKTRTRCIARVTSRSPFKVKIKVELQQFDGLSEEWVAKGNDEKLEQEILTDVRGRLQRR